MNALAEFGKGVLRGAKFYIQAAPLAWPKLVECNVCGWQGKHLVSDGWHERAQCPSCKSGVRHRLLMAAWSHLEDLERNDGFKGFNQAGVNEIIHATDPRKNIGA
jgi:hypothetical protein